MGVSNQDFADYLRTYGQSGVVFGILVAHWTQSLGVNNQDSPPVYVQAPLFLNPVPPFLSLLHETEIRKYAFPVSSYLLFTAMGLLVEAFAIRRLRRSGEQV